MIFFPIAWLKALNPSFMILLGIAVSTIGAALGKHWLHLADRYDLRGATGVS
ncbi:hypothetical protein ACFQ5D_04005 [Paenibacillus farraposensis]|uniref:Uncharacterized protein n=1 Tax=Paenibacillus farraposensis TaxID=2807095 RepID=A0ABW4D7E1_9BACL|nr:hypothetical protein [Paenibacillus farraposensis]